MPSAKQHLASLMELIARLRELEELLARVSEAEMAAQKSRAACRRNRSTPRLFRLRFQHRTR